MYLEVGLVVAADRAFALLDVKHLQLDSLGHLHVPLLAPLGDLPLASTILDHTAKFFMANYKDVCIFKPDKLILRAEYVESISTRFYCSLHVGGKTE